MRVKNLFGRSLAAALLALGAADASADAPPPTVVALALDPAADASLRNMRLLNATLNARDHQRVEIACAPGAASCAFPLVGGARATGRTGLELVIGRGARLVGDYNLSRWAVDATNDFESLVAFDACARVTVRGERDRARRAVSWWREAALSATIDGGGRPWWLRKLAGNATGAPGDPKTPNALGFYWCDDVAVRDVRVTNSPSFGVFVQESQRVLVERCAVTVDLLVTPPPTAVPVWALNTDGFDVGGRDLVLRDVYVRNADDSVAIKPSAPSLRFACTTNVTVENATLIGVGASVGSVHPKFDRYCVRGVTFRDVAMPGTMKGIYVKTDNTTDGLPGDGALVDDVLYENVRVDGAVWWPIWIGPQQQHNDLEVTACPFAFPFGPGPAPDCLGARQANVTGVVLRDVTVTNSRRAFSGMILGNALSPAGPWRVVLERVRVDKPIGCASARVGLIGTDASFFTAPNAPSAGYANCTFYDAAAAAS